MGGLFRLNLTTSDAENAAAHLGNRTRLGPCQSNDFRFFETDGFSEGLATWTIVTPDYLICLEDGKKFKSLRRHLGLLGLTPEQYREKWKLPSDYPMVAPNYAAHRSVLAKKIGLGQIRRKAG